MSVRHYSSSKLPEFVMQLLASAKSSNHSYISLRDFLHEFFKSKEGKTEDSLDFNFGKYLTELASMKKESHNLPVQDLLNIEGLMIEHSISSLFDRAHSAALIATCADRTTIIHWSLIDSLSIMKGLCWLESSRPLLTRICFERDQINVAFRKTCNMFTELNNADVTYSNANSFYHYFMYNDWGQIAAYNELMGITEKTMKNFLEEEFKTRRGPLTIKSELSQARGMSPKEIICFKKAFSLSDAEIQPYITP